MVKIISLSCPKCNNSQNFYRYGKDPDGYQKYLCRCCNHQFAPERPKAKSDVRKYPSCPKCGKACFLHHDYQHYSNFRCGDKACYHSFFVVKGTSIADASMSDLLGKTSFKRMRYPVFVIMTALSMFYLGKSSFRNISLILRTAFNINVSHTTISNWCTNFAPLFDNIRIKLLPMLDFNSDEWHTDETVVKVAGVKHYLWLVVDSETRFIIGFHLSPTETARKPFLCWGRPPSLGNPKLLFRIDTAPTKCRLNLFLRTPHTFRYKASRMIFPIT